MQLDATADGLLFDDLSDEHAAAYHAQHNGTIRAVQRFGRLLGMESR